ncbi:hypothetical protein O181_089202 [Austropuccinia psidii MF-1]|uniref:Tet-like 2OG-Fe(II) oxygenase domain-containing protein n=1 Tax=Austropuccinia psidii MF-1 TaxID=1389203 RepID=A0A9Q3P6C6_9BASI|nr:hypothetical protein [Austropuccinia psidii MF-1]
MEIFSSTGLLIALVKFRPFTKMSEVEVNQWDELSQSLFRKRRFTDPIATNGALLEGFMFAIGWRKCSTKNEQFGLYGSHRKIENTKYEWRNQGANLSSVSNTSKIAYTRGAANTSHPNHYACKSSQQFKLPMPPTQILTLCRFGQC